MRITRPGTLLLPTTFALLVALACSDSTSATPLGKVSAQILDPNDAGVQGADADLYKVVDGGGLLWRASLTNSAGIAVFGESDGGVVTGDYYVHVSFINGYKLADGETNDKVVTVKEGDDDVVTFHAIASGPGH
ncbi:MAG: hypothetical protein ACREMY_04920 [bacterium]